MIGSGGAIRPEAATYSEQAVAVAMWGIQRFIRLRVRVAARAAVFYAPSAHKWLVVDRSRRPHRSRPPRTDPDRQGPDHCAASERRLGPARGGARPSTADRAATSSPGTGCPGWRDWTVPLASRSAIPSPARQADPRNRSAPSGRWPGSAGRDRLERPRSPLRRAVRGVRAWVLELVKLERPDSLGGRGRGAAVRHQCR